MDFSNSYEDEKRADAYDKLEFPGTYYLAYRDLPEILAEHIRGKKAVDFGCGTGRSTRFLKKYGFQTVGIDISADMIKKARQRDPQGSYLHIADGDFSQLEEGGYDLVQSIFTFDNIPTRERKVRLFSRLGRLLKPGGKLISLVSAPEIYVHEWASFSTKDFPENETARSGDKVRIIQTDLEDKRPVQDIIWTDESYREVYQEAGLECVNLYKPLARESEPYQWINETRIAPWTIYILAPLK
jgi:SAM-dependent methyltransferase